MELKNSRSRYSTSLIGLHWLTLLLLVAVYACMELRGLAPKGSDLRANMKSLHSLLGLCVLAVVIVRIGVRWNAGAAPEIRPSTAAYFLIGMHAAAALLHHYVMRDNTLVRMLPRGAAPSKNWTGSEAR
ncbi:cytochrome b [Variovorax ureilyticus]|uniref:cytochrome b n=1 Tax=Variovorax ureilyticus TaxID=1836198 RepID=UPI003D6650EC